MIKNETLSESCIYTIRHSDYLAADHASGGNGKFTEKGRWATGLRLLESARQGQQRVPLLFAPAEANIIDGVFFWALIDDITLAQNETTIRYSSLQRLPKKHRLSSLKKLSDGTPLSDYYIRPYVPCRTPAFLFAAPAPSAPANSIRDIEAEEISAREGAVSTRQHLHRERDRTIIAAKRRQVLAATGRLACAVCGFDFQHFYGKIGEDFCEVHHLRSLSEAAGEVQTRLEDLAVVCSNCHRMLHRSHPFLTLAELAGRITVAR